MLEHIDTLIFLFINRTCHINILSRIMFYMTRLGDGPFLFALALLLMIMKNKRSRAAGILLLAGTTLSYQVVHFLKEIIQRPRPFLVLQNINAFYTPEGYSFPSMHSAMVFMAATVLSLTFGKSYIFYVVAFIVGISRVYLGVHYPYDVFVGGCIGSFLGYFLIRIYNQTARH